EHLLVERIDKPQTHAHRVTLNLLTEREVRPTERRESSPREVHWRAIEVLRGKRERLRELRVQVYTIRPRNTVRLQRRRRSAVRYNLEDIEPGEKIELRSETKLTVHISSPRIALRKVLEADRRNLSAVEHSVRVYVDLNAVV